VFSNKDINSSHSIEPITTDYGYAIKITGAGPLKIDFQYRGLEHFSWNYLVYNYNDSVSYREYAEYLIYYNSTIYSSVHIQIKFEYNGLGSERHLSLQGNLSRNGWQVITGEEDWVQIA
jgi:hypothetical protein